MQVYGSDAASLNNFHIVGNTLFNAGFDTGAQNFVLGGGQVANDPVITDNYVYNRRSYNTNLGYSSGCANAIIRNNIFSAQGDADTPWVEKWTDIGSTQATISEGWELSINLPRGESYAGLRRYGQDAYYPEQAQNVPLFLNAVGS